MERVRVRCGFSSGLSVDCCGQGKERLGGLALMWSDFVDVSICSYSINHIFGRVGNFDDGSQWFLSGMYGFPDENSKRRTRELMKNLSAYTNEIWICFGDLNDILAAHDKKGGNPRSLE